MKKFWSLFLVTCLSLAATAVLAQDVQTKGSIGGTVTDATGAAIVGIAVNIYLTTIGRVAITIGESGRAY